MNFAKWFFGAVSLVGSAAFGQNTAVNWYNDSTTVLRDAAGVALSQGVTNVNRDGALVQLGYFSNGTTASNFSGTWIPLTLTTTVGDNRNLSTGSPAGAGGLRFSTFFNSGTNVVDVFDSEFHSGYYTTTSSVSITDILPTPGQVLAIRFFDSSSSSSGFYNTVSSDTWLWKAPSADDTVSMDFAHSTLEFQDASNPFKTTISAVPEPGTACLALFSFSGMLAGFRPRRRRR